MPSKNPILSFKMAKWIPLWKPGPPDSLPSFRRSYFPSQPTFHRKRPPAVLVQILNSLSTSSPPDFQVKTGLLLSQKPDPNASKMLPNHDTLSPRIFSSENRCFPMKRDTSDVKMSVAAWIKTGNLINYVDDSKSPDIWHPIDNPHR